MKECGVRSAYTLLEVMLALSILGIMGAMIFGSFRSLVDATTRAEKALDELHVVETLANRIADSLQAAAWFDSSPENYEFRHEQGAVSISGDTLSWVTASPPFPVDGLSGLIRVELSVGDADGGEALVMRTMSSLWSENAPEVEDLEPEVITHSVTRLKVWCYDAQEQQWVEEWERKRQLPLSVVFVLTLSTDGDSRNTREIIRRVDLPVAPLSRATSRGRRAVQDPDETQQIPARNQRRGPTPIEVSP